MNNNIRKKILEFAETKEKFKNSNVYQHLTSIGIEPNKDYLSRLLGNMTTKGELVREGHHNETKYALPKYIDKLDIYIRKIFKNENLKEHEILTSILNDKVFSAKLDENTKSIFNYAFSEILNNAIEHSKAANITLNVYIENRKNDELVFEIIDTGIGVFRNVMRQRNLANAFEAMQDILKGKTTTMPQAHSGEGIFFTSKIADTFVLESFGYKLVVDNTIPDVFFANSDTNANGTKATFRIAITTTKRLINLFKEYTSSEMGDFSFNKTKQLVKLFAHGSIYVSRSQARRLLEGLDKFQFIILDFEKIPAVGQAFADEVFRIFKSAHPKIQITTINTNEAVDFMIKRAENPQK